MGACCRRSSIRLRLGFDEGFPVHGSIVSISRASVELLTTELPVMDASNGDGDWLAGRSLRLTLRAGLHQHEICVTRPLFFSFFICTGYVAILVVVCWLRLPAALNFICQCMQSLPSLDPWSWLITQYLLTAPLLPRACVYQISCRCARRVRSGASQSYVIHQVLSQFVQLGWDTRNSLHPITKKIPLNRSQEIN